MVLYGLLPALHRRGSTLHLASMNAPKHLHKPLSTSYSRTAGEGKPSCCAAAKVFRCQHNSFKLNCAAWERYHLGSSGQLCMNCGLVVLSAPCQLSLSPSTWWQSHVLCNHAICVCGVYL